MTGYTAADVFTAPEIYDLSDLVQGGASGDANAPLKALADQTNYLKNRLRRWEGVRVITDNYPVDAVTDLGYLLFVQISANKTLTLPDVGAFLIGTRVKIITAITGIKALTVQTSLSQAIIDGSIAWAKWDTGAPGIYMHDTEKLVLVAAGDHWLVEDAIGNFYTYGDTYGARIQRGNTVIAKGDTYNRADMPRIAMIIAAAGSSVTTEFNWITYGDNYKGCFSKGDGTSTFRVPDERGMFDRYLDLGRGVDLYRTSSLPGGYEKDAVGPFTANITGRQAALSGGNGGVTNAVLLKSTLALPFTEGTEQVNGLPVTTGNIESIVKNIAKIPLVKY